MAEEMHGEIWIDKVKPDTNNPRKEFGEEELHALAEGIKLHGVIDPIEIDENNIIVDGERRWRASKMAGLTKIPFKRKMMGEHEKQSKGYRIKEQLQANLTGENLRVYEAREAIESLMSAADMKPIRGKHSEESLSKLAKELGISHNYLSTILKLSKDASPEVIEAVEKKQIPFSTAVEISTVKDKAVQKDFLDYAKVEELTRDDTRKLSKKLKEVSPKEAKNVLATDRIMSPELQKSIEVFAAGVKKAYEDGKLGRKPDDGFSNLLFLSGIVEQLKHKDIFCPTCKNPKGLQWACCKESVETTVEKLSKKYKMKQEG